MTETPRETLYTLYIYTKLQWSLEGIPQRVSLFCVVSSHAEGLQTHFANFPNKNKIKYFLAETDIRRTQTPPSTFFPGEQTPPWSVLLLRIIPGRILSKFQTNRGNITKTAGRIHPGICTRCCQVWNIKRKLRQLPRNSGGKRNIPYNFSIKKIMLKSSNNLNIAKCWIIRHVRDQFM